jgi:UDP-N-acetyl-D-galactosamine dehydrogenase
VIVHVHDPVASPEHAQHEYGITLRGWDELPRANAIVAAVAHQDLVAHKLDDVCAKLAPNGVYVDVKCKADQAALRARGIDVWRL